MKKLVTIVSAVMMLLMLAACSSGISFNADQIEEASNGQLAISAIKQAAQEAFTKKFNDAEDKHLGSTYEYTAPEDVEVTIGSVTYTVVKGSKISCATEANAFGEVSTATLGAYTDVNGSVSWKVGDDAEATTFKVVYSNEVAKDGSYKMLYTVNGNDYTSLYKGGLGFFED